MSFTNYTWNGETSRIFTLGRQLLLEESRYILPYTHHFITFELVLVSVKFLNEFSITRHWFDGIQQWMLTCTFQNTYNVSLSLSSFFEFSNLLGKGKEEKLIGIKGLGITFVGGISFQEVVASSFSRPKSLLASFLALSSSFLPLLNL